MIYQSAKTSALKITIIPRPVRISLRPAPQTGKNLLEWLGAVINRLENLPLSTAGKIVEQGIFQMAEYYDNVVVDKFCIMPDHIHLILRIKSDIDGR